MTAWGSIKGDPKSGFAKRLLWDNFVPPNSTLIRRSVFETVQGFDANLKGVDDFDLWYRIARDFKATICEIPLATWRYNNESSISFDQSLMIEDESRFYKKILALPDATNLEKEVCKERISMNQVRLANQKLAVGQ